ncbi:MAG: PAS domain-containing sensor histidine kinase [Burkholderiales bacterium PBB3]|nr:MAG: PAS domain-containing sensor histidine kinase [Burkholderiales bacterium PBB3]
MPKPTAEHIWLGTAAGPPTALSAPEDSAEFDRLWHAFMASRLALGLVLVVLQGALYATGTGYNFDLVTVSAAYFAITIVTRLVIKPRPMGGSFNRRWVGLVGIDVLAILVLQHLQGSSINYTPLFALPILLASVLGTLRLALGTAAGVTVLLLSGTLWGYLGNQIDAMAYYVQAALTGVGYFAIALLASQLSTRLASEGQRAHLSQLAARIQQQVNELVIESLPDGVLIVDDQGIVRGANPSARQLLGVSAEPTNHLFNLKDDAAWLPLLNITRMSIGTGRAQEADVTMRQANQGDRRMRARTRLAAPQGMGAASLCVLFLQDQRELEARMRTEKLASMGRMSTAVAHEIRNPLAAIAQANALLEEDLTDPHHQRLTRMVGHNAKRLEKIVDDILDVARIGPADTALTLQTVRLPANVEQICNDWGLQNTCMARLHCVPWAYQAVVRFDLDHLQRVLVNLLDNAARYASTQPEAIQVACGMPTPGGGTLMLSVWSDGAPMEQSVERHLFEPFFSSESRSSGLGLYICRELCDRHGASITYQRSARLTRDTVLDGNEFLLTLQLAPVADGSPSA